MDKKEATVGVFKSDGETSIEFIGDDWRFGICLDDKNESSWYLVTKDLKHTDCGWVPREVLDLFKGNYEEHDGR